MTYKGQKQSGIRGGGARKESIKTDSCDPKKFLISPGYVVLYDTFIFLKPNKPLFSAFPR